MDLEFDIIEFEEADHPTPGDTAPAFTRPLVGPEHWEDVSLSALTDDGPVALIFHSMDGAFPATYVWNELRDRRMYEHDVRIVGLSVSTPYEHKTLIEERGLEETGVRLYSDPANDVAAEYGIVNDLDGMHGVTEPRPAAFVLDEDRTVQYAWVADQWPDFPEYDELEAAIEDVSGD